MTSLYILIGISILMAAGVLVLLFWAHRKGQFDDPEGPKYRIFDDE